MSPKNRKKQSMEMHRFMRRIAYNFIDYNMTLSIHEYRLFDHQPTNWPVLEETFYELLDRAEYYFKFN